jgi:hypothetical protein
MKTTKLLIALTACMLGTGPALASDIPSASALASIAQGEHAKLDVGSIERLGPQARFDVSVHSTSAQASREYTPRRIRYVADCSAGKMAVAAVAVAAKEGQATTVDQTTVVPPGAEQWMKPAAGSQSASWLSDACNAYVG